MARLLWRSSNNQGPASLFPCGEYILSIKALTSALFSHKAITQSNARSKSSESFVCLGKIKLPVAQRLRNTAYESLNNAVSFPKNCSGAVHREFKTLGRVLVILL